MGVLQRFEHRLESLVGTTFARIFKGQVEPVEVAKALQREAETKRAIVGMGQILVPNRYLVELSSSDYDRLAPWEAQLADTLAEMVQEHIDGEGWSAYGDIEVKLACADELTTGVFRVASRVDPDAAPRRRPRDPLTASSIRSPVTSDSFNEPNESAYSDADNGYGAQEQLQAWIMVDGSDRQYQLEQGVTAIGRSQETDIRLPDTGVSRRHIEVHVTGQSVVLHDLGSTNGTTVNGHHVQSHQLRHGDVIRLGHSTLVYRQDYP